MMATARNMRQEALALAPAPPAALVANLERRYEGRSAVRSVGETIGAALGYEGRLGGWIYDSDGTVVCQGYATLAHHYRVFHFTLANVPRARSAWRLPIEQVDRILLARARKIARAEATALNVPVCEVVS